MLKADRRRSRRCTIDFFVQEVVGGRTYLHPAINLSEHGIYILANDDRIAIDGDQALNLEFTLPTGRPIQATGKVVHVDDRRGERGIGIQFTDIDAEDSTAIAEFIDRMHSEYYSDKAANA